MEGTRKKGLSSPAVERSASELSYFSQENEPTDSSPPKSSLTIHQESPLLALPGGKFTPFASIAVWLILSQGLRNRIYHPIIADKSDNEKAYLTYCQHCTAPLSSRENSRPYLGLTQINKLLGLEVKPILSSGHE
jgi:hypothetical protein